MISCRGNTQGLTKRQGVPSHALGSLWFLKQKHYTIKLQKLKHVTYELGVHKILDRKRQNQNCKKGAYATLRLCNTKYENSLFRHNEDPYTQNTKYRFKTHTVDLLSGAFLLCERDRVFLIVSHSRLGEQKTKYVEYGI